MFFNMKIEVNEDQPLDDVVRELERIGYRKIAWIGYRGVGFVTTNTQGFYTDHVVNLIDCFLNLNVTTLAELKGMKCSN